MAAKFKWVSPAETAMIQIPKPFTAAPAFAKAAPVVTPPPAPTAPGPGIGPVTHGPAVTTADIPQLEGDAAKAVAHRGSHIQIIAAAGSGKTEVVSQRVASLLADGEAPESIVAFTFTSSTRSAGSSASPT